jgi:2-oxoglutarate dehydrogenase E2 component (dihydrolipoamide succinyltransferase)
MPQMGESVAEGTIVRWLKKVGDSIERDEPLFEISTDKVDAEIPSPAAGVVSAYRTRRTRRRAISFAGRCRLRA